MTMRTEAILHCKTNWADMRCYAKREIDSKSREIGSKAQFDDVFRVVRVFLIEK
jgi:hypothetical protein